MNRNHTASTAVGKIPSWLYGGDILGYAREAQLKVRPVDIGQFSWRIQALERYERRTARLVDRIEIAGPGAPGRWDVLNQLPASRVGNTVPPQLVERLRRQLVEDTAEDDFLAKFNWLRASMTLAKDNEFIEAARSAFESLRSVRTVEGEPFFPDLAASFIRFDQALSWRTGLARVMVRTEEEPALLNTRPQQRADQLVFGSATGILTDLPLTRDAYLVPLFLCRSPFIWAITGPREQGVMVYSLGRPMRGQETNPAELIQQFMPGGPAIFPECPPFTATQTSTALAWWVKQLNELLSVVTDPSTYVNQAGEYNPRRQFEAQLSFEQAGRRIQAVLAHQRDQATRQVLAFAALDTFEGLGLVNFDQAVQLTKAQKVLERLGTLLPFNVAEILLPSARRAVNALRDCQDGFLENAYVSGDQVTVPHKSGQSRIMTVEQAMGQYLRVLRNAHHGYGGQNDAGRRRDEVLLMSHTGDLPSDFVLLPYLYWLDALADPQRLRRTLAPRH
ncbi:hypothetical protein OG496_28335 [Streptomyces sp. NBC_00988]|uniref:hypothetical protein n=1 Tax=Streptomyces sp. NBC_00988 TaxID=2903704 RepID=UPI00386CD04E|nr:hypothetical protein OG496_28335 [Streptomyces sp. NBC_00988]